MVEITPPQRVEDTRHEGWAAVWLTFGLLLGPLGVVVGSYLTVRSTRWSLGWKLTALALPVVLLVSTRTFPREASGWVWFAFLLGVVGLVMGSIHGLEGVASHGSGHGRPSRVVALVLAVVLAAIVSRTESRLHPIGSYDYHDDVVAAAHAADAAGQRYGVVTEAFTDSSDEQTTAKIARLAGPGNARFDAIFDKLEAEDDDDEGTPRLSRQQLGRCHVFPVVTSRRQGVESASGLARLCTGPSGAGFIRPLSDR